MHEIEAVPNGFDFYIQAYPFLSGITKTSVFPILKICYNDGV